MRKCLKWTTFASESKPNDMRQIRRELVSLPTSAASLGELQTAAIDAAQRGTSLPKSAIKVVTDTLAVELALEEYMLRHGVTRRQLWTLMACRDSVAHVGETDAERSAHAYHVAAQVYTCEDVGALPICLVTISKIK